MTKYTLGLLCALLLLPAARGPAQNPTPAPSPGDGEVALDANYVITLSPVEKDGVGFSIITAVQRFGLSNKEALLLFNGTLYPQKDGSYRLDYRLTNDDGKFETAASVYLRPGEPVQAIKNGKQFYNLRLDHYPPPNH